ncbi:hypothetical protein [Aliikangiella sp. IMCC44359]|uniref:hypothetical protein n=1 Tax=Aliikangiella sp. IMCC44359 TaxID=3459125 RepID=UPI00403B05A6
MRKLLVLIFMIPSLVYSNDESLIIFPELKKSVNAFTEDNMIPWHKKNNGEISLEAVFSHYTPLMQYTKGDYSYKLYKIFFHNIKVKKGVFNDKRLNFFILSKFPTKESGIYYRVLWPFSQKHLNLNFEIDKVEESYKIISMSR